MTKNVVSSLQKCALTGCVGKTAIHDRIVKVMNCEYHGLPRILCAVREKYSHRKPLALIAQLHALLSRILYFENTCASFVASGGMGLLVDVLFCDEKWLRGAHDGKASLSLWAWNMSMRILTDLTVQDESLPAYLHHTYPHLLNRVIWLLQFNTTFENGVILCEHILSSAGPMVVSHCSVDFLVSLIPLLNERNLALLCRPIAMILNFSSLLNTSNDDLFTEAFVSRAHDVQTLLDRHQIAFIDALKVPSTCDKFVDLLRFELPRNAVCTQYGRTFALSIPMTTQMRLNPESQNELMRTAGEDPEGLTIMTEDMPSNELNLRWFCRIE